MAGAAAQRDQQQNFFSFVNSTDDNEDGWREEFLSLSLRFDLSDSEVTDPLLRNVIQSGKANILQLFLDQGPCCASCNAEESLEHFAASYANRAIIQVMLDSGRFDFGQPNICGQYPIHYAVSANNTDIFNLITQRDHLYARAEDGATPLGRGAGRVCFASIKALLECMSSLSEGESVKDILDSVVVLDEDGSLVIHAMVNGWYSEVDFDEKDDKMGDFIRLFEEYAPDLSKVDAQGRTVLHCAIPQRESRQVDKSFFKYLLLKVCMQNPELLFGVDSNGKTVQDWARDTGRDDVADFVGSLHSMFMESQSRADDEDVTQRSMLDAIKSWTIVAVDEMTEDEVDEQFSHGKFYAHYLSEYELATESRTSRDVVNDGSVEDDDLFRSTPYEPRAHKSAKGRKSPKGSSVLPGLDGRRVGFWQRRYLKRSEFLLRKRQGHDRDGDAVNGDGLGI